MFTFVEDERRLPNQAVPWVNADFPCVFYDVNGTENRLNGFDFKNVAESLTVQHLINRMIQNGISAERIGIMTQFAGQKNHLVCSLMTRTVRMVVKLC